jgi:hypothetical protein
VLYLSRQIAIDIQRAEAVKTISERLVDHQAATILKMDLGQLSKIVDLIIGQGEVHLPFE